MDQTQDGSKIRSALRDLSAVANIQSCTLTQIGDHNLENAKEDSISIMDNVDTNREEQTKVLTDDVGISTIKFESTESAARFQTNYTPVSWQDNSVDATESDYESAHEGFDSTISRLCNDMDNLLLNETEQEDKLIVPSFEIQPISAVIDKQDKEYGQETNSFLLEKRKELLGSLEDEFNAQEISCEFKTSNFFNLSKKSELETMLSEEASFEIQPISAVIDKQDKEYGQETNSFLLEKRKELLGSLEGEFNAQEISCEFKTSDFFNISKKSELETMLSEEELFLKTWEAAPDFITENKDDDKSLECSLDDEIRFEHCVNNNIGEDIIKAILFEIVDSICNCQIATRSSLEIEDNKKSVGKNDAQMTGNILNEETSAHTSEKLQSILDSSLEIEDNKKSVGKNDAQMTGNILNEETCAHTSEKLQSISDSSLEIEDNKKSAGKNDAQMTGNILNEETSAHTSEKLQSISDSSLEIEDNKKAAGKNDAQITGNILNEEKSAHTSEKLQSISDSSLEIEDNKKAAGKNDAQITGNILNEETSAHTSEKLQSISDSSLEIEDNKKAAGKNDAQITGNILNEETSAHTSKKLQSISDSSLEIEDNKKAAGKNDAQITGNILNEETSAHTSEKLQSISDSSLEIEDNKKAAGKNDAQITGNILNEETSAHTSEKLQSISDSSLEIEDNKKSAGKSDAQITGNILNEETSAHTSEKLQSISDSSLEIEDNKKSVGKNDAQITGNILNEETSVHTSEKLQSISDSSLEIEDNKKAAGKNDAQITGNILNEETSVHTSEKLQSISDSSLEIEDNKKSAGKNDAQITGNILNEETSAHTSEKLQSISDSSLEIEDNKKSVGKNDAQMTGNILNEETSAHTSDKLQSISDEEFISGDAITEDFFTQQKCDLFKNPQDFEFLMEKGTTGLNKNKHITRPSILAKFDPLFVQCSPVKQMINISGSSVDLGNTDKDFSPSLKRIVNENRKEDDIFSADMLSTGVSDNKIIDHILCPILENLPNINVEKAADEVNKIESFLVEKVNKNDCITAEQDFQRQEQDPLFVQCSPVKQMINISGSSVDLGNTDKDFSPSSKRIVNENREGDTFSADMLSTGDPKNKIIDHRLCPILENLPNINVEKAADEVNKIESFLVEKVNKNDCVIAEQDFQRQEQEELEKEINSLQLQIQEYDCNAAKITQVINEYDQIVDELVNNISSLSNECAETKLHVRSAEMALADVKSKFEKSSEVIWTMKSKQELALKAETDTVKMLEEKETDYEILKTETMQKLQSLNEKYMNEINSHKKQVMILDTMIKKSTVKNGSLQRQLEQKISEQKELSEMCDELVNSIQNHQLPS